MSLAVAGLSLGAAVAAGLDCLAGRRFESCGGHIVELLRYPVKSLTREVLSSVVVEAERTFPGDREWAIIRGARAGLHDPQQSRWINKTNFHVMMLDASLSGLQVAYDAATSELAIQQDGATALRAKLATEAGRAAAEDFFAQYLGPEALEPPEAGGPALRLVRSAVPGHAFHNHNGQLSNQIVHIVNLATVRALEAALGKPLSAHRFRANILLDGLEPWVELGWVGKRIRFSGVKGGRDDEVEMEVECPTIRCPATQVDHDSGQRDTTMVWPNFPAKAFPAETQAASVLSVRTAIVFHCTGCYVLHVRNVQLLLAIIGRCVRIVPIILTVISSRRTMLIV